MNESNEKIVKRKDPGKMVKIIIASMIGALVLLALLVWLLESVAGDGGERETLPPVDPLKLHETKEEDFDIMEYDEYLDLDRNVYLNDKHSGVVQSITEEDCDNHGAPTGVLYRVLMAIRAGDHAEYNNCMGQKFLKKDSFTQQQIYDIEISPYSSGTVKDDDGAYNEYVFKVTYRIHENNGTYRNTIESDVSRPQYFIINDSTGKLLVMDIVEQGYKK